MKTEYKKEQIAKVARNKGSSEADALDISALPVREPPTYDQRNLLNAGNLPGAWYTGRDGPYFSTRGYQGLDNDFDESH